MSARLAGLWQRIGEAALLLMAFFLPLAFYLRTYDSATIKTATFQLGALVLLGAWFLKGLELGRWELPGKARALLFPAFALFGWTVFRYLAAPYKLAALDGFLEQIVQIAIFCLVLLEFGGTDYAKRFIGWTLAAAWAAGLYGLFQNFGFDPFIWKGGFEARIFSTAANPDCFAVFLALCLPLALIRLLDPDRGPARKTADACLILLIAADVVWTSSVEGLAAFVIQGAVFSCVVAFSLPRSARRIAAFCGLVTVGAVFAAVQRGDAGFQARLLRDVSFKESTWAATERLIAERPLEGHGPGSFFIQYPRFRPPEIIALEGYHYGQTAHPESLLLETASELGGLGAALWLWLFGAVVLAGVRAGKYFRERGSVPESLYLTALLSATLGSLIASQLVLGAHFVMPGWFLWPLAGLLGGMTLLSGKAEASAVLPLPFDARLRRLLYIPALAAFCALAYFPMRWFDSDIEHNMAIAFSKEGDFADALLHYDRVAPGAPMYVMAQYFKGNVLLEQKKPADALAQYAYLETIAPDYTQLHFQEGQAYARLGDWENAMKSYERARKLDPLFVPTYVGMADAARAAGNMKEARRATFTAIGMEPETPEHWLALAQLYVQEKRLAAAHRVERQAARLETGARKGGG